MLLGDHERNARLRVTTLWGILWKLVTFWTLPTATLTVARKHWFCDILWVANSIILSFPNVRIPSVNAVIPLIGYPGAKLCIYPADFRNATSPHTWRLCCFLGFLRVGGECYEKHWAHRHQYIQTKWACRLPYGERSKEGQENQPGTDRQRQSEEDTTVGMIEETIPD